MTRFDDAAFERFRERLARRSSIDIEPGPHRRACVVAPMIRRQDGWHLLVLRRSDALSSHRGQIAFPGGATEPDETLQASAIREAEEEVGIPRESIEIIGRLDDLITISGYVVAPFVGVIPAGIEYVLQASEVDEVFEVPLDALMAPENPRIRYVGYKGREYPTYAFHHQSLEIWGLTGRMVKELIDVVWESR